MPTDEHTYAERTRRAFNAILSGVHVSGPGLVKAVSGSAPNRKLRVQPMIAELDRDGVPHAYDDIHDVLLVPIGGGGWQVDITPGFGDIVWLLFSDRALDDFKRTKSTVAPAAKRTHDIQDAVAIPTNLGAGASNGISITHESGSPGIHLTSTGIEVSGNLDVTGVCRVGTVNPVTAITVNTHTHPISGGGTTDPPSPG